MPDSDTVTPLCSYASFVEGAFADLVSGFTQSTVTDFLIEATRKCESLTDRRLAPFTVTETVRAQGIDTDELGGYQGLPVSFQSSLGYSEALALGVTNLVRHTWLAQYPPRYPDLWTTSPAMTVTIVRSYGGTEELTSGQILDGPDDTGHVWLQLGTFVPSGSRIRVTYSGGYTVATPADLTRACRYFTAGIAVTELNPEDAQHDPDRLFALGEKWLQGYMRDGGMPK